MRNQNLFIFQKTWCENKVVRALFWDKYIDFAPTLVVTVNIASNGKVSFYIN